MIKMEEKKQTIAQKKAECGYEPKPTIMCINCEHFTFATKTTPSQYGYAAYDTHYGLRCTLADFPTQKMAHCNLFEKKK
jgi:hypothetical protein